MKIINLLLTLEIIFLVGVTKKPPIVAQEIALSTLCNKFPVNSRCQNYQDQSLESNTKLYQQLDRHSFCQEFSFNSRCQKEPVKVIKVNLSRSGENDEWVRMEKNGNKVRLLHTTKVRDDVASTVVDGVVGLIPYPIPFDTNKYNWEDHQVTQVSFQSDRCKTDSCIVTGKKTLKLPQKTNIYQGLFTIAYQEEDIARTISFKIPADMEGTTVETAKTITVGIPE